VSASAALGLRAAPSRGTNSTQAINAAAEEVRNEVLSAINAIERAASRKGNCCLTSPLLDPTPCLLTPMLLFLMTEKRDAFLGTICGTASLVLDSLTTYPLRLVRWRHQIIPSHLDIPTSQLFAQVLDGPRPQALWQGFWTRLVSEILCSFTEKQFLLLLPPPRSSLPLLLTYQLSLSAVSFLWNFPLHRASVLLGVQFDIFPTRRYFRGRIHCVLDYLTYFWPGITAVPPPLPNRLSLDVVATPSVAHYALRSLLFGLVGDFVFRRLARRSRRLAPAHQDGGAESSETVHARLLASFAGVVVSQFILFPLEMVSARLLVQGTGVLHPSAETDYTGFWDCVTKVAATEGYSAFYSGVGAMLTRFIISGIILEGIQVLQTAISARLTM